MKNKNLKSALLKFNEIELRASNEIEVLNPDHAIEIKGGYTCSGNSSSCTAYCGKLTVKVCGVNLFGE